MSAQWISKLNQSNSRLHKEEVLREAQTAATLGCKKTQQFLTLLKICYNPYLTFGVRKVEDKTEETENITNDWNLFTQMLNYLAGRVYTGNTAKEIILEARDQFSIEEWNTFAAPVLRRDIRAGISATTINKIFKKTEWEIPVFKCQLATNSESRPEMTGEKIVEPKLDGVRAFFVLDTTEFGTSDDIIVTCVSRNGKQFENFKHIERQLTRLVYSPHTNIFSLLDSNGSRRYPSSPASGVVIDGEIIGQSFQSLMRQAQRKTDVQADDCVFKVFDIVPYVDYFAKQKVARWTQEERSKFLLELDKIGVFDDMPNVEVVEQTVFDLSSPQGMNDFEN